jgi:pteridine reductase
MQRPGSALVCRPICSIRELPGWSSCCPFRETRRLVNNASSFFPTALGEIDEAAWLDLIGSNLKAPLFLVQAAAQAAGGPGAVVNIIDIHAERPSRAIPCIARQRPVCLD